MKKSGKSPLGSPESERSVAASLSASKAAQAGRCGQALDDLIVAVSLHADDTVRRRAVSGDRDSYLAMQTAKELVRRHCLVNVAGRGLHGARRRR